MMYHGAWAKSFVVLTVLAALLLGASGGAATAAGKPAELSVWHIWSGTRQPLLREVLDRFEAQNPAVKVEDLLVSGDLAEKTVTGWAAGAGPDVAMMGLTEVPQWAELGLVMPLDDFARNEGLSFSRLLYPSVAEVIAWKGRTYYLPQLLGSHHFLYYNTDLFAQAGVDPSRPPATHSQFLEVAKRTTRQNADGTLQQLGVDIMNSGSLAFFNLTAYLEQLGTSNVDTTRRQVLPQLDKAVGTLEWMVDFGNRVAGNVQVGTAFAGNPVASLENGKLAMHTTAEYVYYQIKSAKPDFPLAMGLRPRPDGQPIRTYAEPAWGYGIYSGTKHPEAAWQLVKWLGTAREGGGYFVQQQSRVSAAPGVNNDPENLRRNPYWPVITAAVEHSGFWGLRSFGMADAQFQKHITQAMQDAAKGTQSARNGLLNAKQQLQGSLDEWWTNRK
jgi:multiple sugar transport system substrate-binding protein